MLGGVAGNDSFRLDGDDITEQFCDENDLPGWQSQVFTDAVQEWNWRGLRFKLTCPNAAISPPESPIASLPIVLLTTISARSSIFCAKCRPTA
jgi:hypothetical protein